MTPKELAEVLRYLSPTGNLDGLIAMLFAHFDESSSQNPKDVYAVAGYLGSARKWIRFSRRWPETLAEFKIDPPVFHMSEFESRIGRFAHLTNAERKELVLRLAAVIRDHAKVGVAQVMPVALFDQICDRWLGDSEDDYRNPYKPLLMACMKRLDQYCAGLAPHQKIQCIFHRNYDAAGVIERTIESVTKEFFPHRFATPYISDSAESCIPLQAADFLAYETMKVVKNRVIGPTFRPPRKSLAALQKNMLLLGAYYQPELLEQIYAQARIEAELGDRPMPKGPIRVVFER